MSSAFIIGPVRCTIMKSVILALNWSSETAFHLHFNGLFLIPLLHSVLELKSSIFQTKFGWRRISSRLKCVMTFHTSFDLYVPFPGSYQTSMPNFGPIRLSAEIWPMTFRISHQYFLTCPWHSRGHNTHTIFQHNLTTRVGVHKGYTQTRDRQINSYLLG